MLCDTRVNRIGTSAVLAGCAYVELYLAVFTHGVNWNTVFLSNHYPYSLRQTVDVHQPDTWLLQPDPSPTPGWLVDTSRDSTVWGEKLP